MSSFNSQQLYGWTPDEDFIAKIGKVETSIDPFFPFLDMKMHWDANDSLSFSVFIKPNQELKYLNADSSHTPGCFKAIPKGISHRLALLTTAAAFLHRQTLASSTTLTITRVSLFAVLVF
jgi:hypothetical protein